MKTYIGTKIIQASPVTRGNYNALRGWTPPEGEDQSVDGYLVRYPDGYTSWSPKEQFEAAYRDIEGPAQALTFGDALHMLKLGKRAARAGWNGKGMFVYYVPAASYPVQTGAAKSHFGEGSMVPYNAYFAIKNVNDTVSTWVPSINDCIAEDWLVIE